ncbi:NAD(P)-dependent alcohol dehydrogenase [Nocardiopsis sp. CNT-189]|uniref:NAD(P)-dependent alcohol dehydrogenase n=1 Tax=Nocardiopsis oceanisediminis TaxID=2816862 RepID=UPI003B3B2F3C
MYGELPGGAYAEDALSPKPAGLGFAEAAAVPLAGVAALRGLRDAGGVRPGHRVLVNGASGGVGMSAVQIARALGADVIGVCSTRDLDRVRSYGADRAVDCTREDPLGDRSYDVILDLVGSRTPAEYRRVLRGGVYVGATGMPGGRLLGPLPYLLRAVLWSRRGGPRAVMFAARPNRGDLAVLTEMIEAGRVRPAVGRTCALDGVAEALARQGEGHAQGRSVVAVRS